MGSSLWGPNNSSWTFKFDLSCKSCAENRLCVTTSSVLFLLVLVPTQWLRESWNNAIFSSCTIKSNGNILDVFCLIVYTFPFTQPDIFFIFGDCGVGHNLNLLAHVTFICNDWSTDLISGLIFKTSFLIFIHTLLLHTMPVKERVFSLFVCSYGQVKWPVLGFLPLMAGRWILW